MYFYALIDPVI